MIRLREESLCESRGRENEEAKDGRKRGKGKGGRKKGENEGGTRRDEKLRVRRRCEGEGYMESCRDNSVSPALDERREKKGPTK
jgi:hypothetical protein